ncbi:MAG: Mur ligase family protein [Bacillota bacterium]|nr:Mur ligase family protein [Bacillota bacterium]
MTKAEACDLVYKSFLKAQKYQDYHARDSVKRRPDLTRNLIHLRAGTACVLITGSKGKGAVATMISQILQTRLKVGLMTSPHIVDFCERFRINGLKISDEDFVRHMAAIQPEIDAIERKLPENVCISPMGIQAALGLEYFNHLHTDFNVFECGKGAQFDDVNNIPHQYAVINSIFLEHTRELGDTLEAIAADKSHVISEELKCAYLAEQSQAVLDVFEKRAAAYGVPLKLYGRDFRAENIRYASEGMRFDLCVGSARYPDMTLPLLGDHQARNCALAMALCRDVLGELNIDEVKEKLSAIEWPGRMEVISQDPFMLLDTCIHAASCENVKKVLKHLGLEKPTVIVAIPNDKDYRGVIREMHSVSGRIILSRSQSPHYVFSAEQCQVMANEGIATTWTQSIDEAIGMAKELRLPIVILGTTSIVPEVKQYQSRTHSADRAATAEVFRSGSPSAF